MKKFRVIILSVLSVWAGIASTAAPHLVALENRAYLGEILEDDGEVTGKFLLVNQGEELSFIKDVRVSCGCTNVNFPKEGIHPGDTAVITFVFNPEGRIGAFEKNIKVYAEGLNSPLKLTFAGKVKAGEASVKGRYPFEKGGLRYETDHLKIGELNRGERRFGFIGVYNGGNIPINPEFEVSPRGPDVTFTPLRLEPGESGLISVYINSANLSSGLHEFQLKPKGDKAVHNDDGIKISFFILPAEAGPLKK